MRGTSRRPIIGICHGMEFISDVPALSIRDIVDISGPRDGTEDRLICRIELGDVYSGADIWSPPFQIAKRALSISDDLEKKEVFFFTSKIIILLSYNQSMSD